MGIYFIHVILRIIGSILDAFEGEEFVRTEVTVERYDELEIDTYIYVLKHDKDEINDE